MVALDSAVILNPQVWVASGHVVGLLRPDGRLPHLQAPLPRRPHRARAPAASKPSKHPGEHAECDLTEPRHFNLMFETYVGALRDDASVAYLRPGDGPGHLRQLQERHLVAARQAAVRDRADRQELPQRDHARQLPLPHARVRADGDGVLRAAGRRRGVVPRTGSTQRRQLAHRPRRPPSPTCACARTRPTSCRTTRARRRTSSTCSRSAGSELEGVANRGDYDLRQHSRGLGHDARVDRPRGALRAVRDRAGGRRRPRVARIPVRRLRRGGGRRPPAHACCACIRASRR